MQHEDVDGFPAGAGGDPGRAGIAGGRADDRDPFAARCQHGIEQPADQLQGIILEGQGRAVEQLLKIQAVVQTDQGRHGGIVETGIGGGGERRQVRRRGGSGHERGTDFRSKAGIGKALPAGQGLRRPVRPGLRDIQAAVPRQTREQDIVEGGRRCGATGADVGKCRSVHFSLGG